jgi:hypothetical protein
MNEILLPKARLYAARRQLDLAEKLGSGKDGIVLAAKHKNKPADVAVKVLRLEEPYWSGKAGVSAPWNGGGNHGAGIQCA